MTDQGSGRPADRRASAWHRAPVALLRLDADGVVLDANELLLRWLGRPRRAVVGQARIGELLTVGGRIFWETHVGPMLRLQGRVDEVAVELRCAEGRKPVLMSVRAGARPGGRRGEFDDDGETVVDVALFAAEQRVRYEREIVAARDDAERTAERLRTLQAVSVALAPVLGVDALADALGAALARSLGVRATALWLPGTDGRWRRLGAPTSYLHDADVPPAPGPDGFAAEPDGSVVLELTPRSDLRGRLVVTPSGSAGDLPLDVDTLVAVARQASVALGRAALAEHSASVARELQHAMLRGEQPQDDRFELVTVYRPGVRTLEVGGDWYDAFWLADGVVALVVGDVVGRGLNAAATMGQLRTAVRAVATADLAPDEVLDRLDAFVERTSVGFSASLVYAAVDLQDGLVRYACAGHPPPLVVGGSGGARLVWGGRSATLGVPRTRRSATASLLPGDTLLLYTDGLVERRDRGLREGFAALVASASRRRDEGHAFDDGFVDEQLVGIVESDDTCLLAMTWRGGA